MPASLSLVLLAYLFIFLPWGVWKSARRFNALRATRHAAATAGRATGVAHGRQPDGVMPTPATIYLNTMINMAILFALAFLAARQVGHDLFRIERFGAREALACAAWFAASFAIGLLSRAGRSADELRRLPMLDLVPRTGRDWVAFTAVAIAAGVCEEAAYRGIGFEALRWWLRDMPGAAMLAGPVAAMLSATAFALAHQVQGGRTMAIVFILALLMQALVWYTGTLVVAMAGHAVLDLVTAYRSLGLVRRLEAEGTAG